MEIHLHVRRRHLVLLLAVAAVVLGGVAYAAIPDAGGVYTACRLNATGTIRLIDPSLGSSNLLGHCVALESKITWNQTGQAGISPKVAQLAAGDSNCPAGGASITDGDGRVAYVCNGAAAPFSGTFTSPNGQFTLAVADGGVSITGPDSSISLPAAGGIVVHGGNILTIANDATTQIAHDASTAVGHDRVESIGNDQTTHVGRNRTEVVDNDQSLTVHSADTVKIDQDRHLTVGGNDLIRVSGGRNDDVDGLLALRASAGASILGSSVSINGMGGCEPAARVADLVSSTAILTGSATVCIGG
jgi:hypothetical protein